MPEDAPLPIRLCGGPHGGLDLDLAPGHNGRLPETLRTMDLGGHVAVIYPVTYLSPLFGDDPKTLRYMEHADDCYRRSEFADPAGRVAYHWHTADGGVDNGAVTTFPLPARWAQAGGKLSLHNAALLRADFDTPDPPRSETLRFANGSAIDFGDSDPADTIRGLS